MPKSKKVKKNKKQKFDPIRLSMIMIKRLERAVPDDEGDVIYTTKLNLKKFYGKDLVNNKKLMNEMMKEYDRQLDVAIEKENKKEEVESTYKFIRHYETGDIDKPEFNGMKFNLKEFYNKPILSNKNWMKKFIAEYNRQLQTKKIRHIKNLKTMGVRGIEKLKRLYGIDIKKSK
jgi:hypothetical protein